MTFNDIFKSSFLENVTSVSIFDMVIAMGLAFAVGIVLVAGMIPLAAFGSVIIGIFLLIFANRKSHLLPYIVVLSCSDHDSEVNAKEVLQKNVSKMVVKSKSAQKDYVELNIEVRLSSDNTDFVNELANISGVKSAVLVSYNGEYMG